jgi:hypothetical protein
MHNLEPDVNIDFMLCDCNSPSHQIIIGYDEHVEGWPEIYLSIHLIKRGFWRRLKYAVKYLFGYKSRYGAWDEFLFCKDHIPVVKRLLSHLESIPESINLEGPDNAK